MGPGEKQSEDRTVFKAKAASVCLPKHSYWFDFWVFVLFDIALFLVIYFVVP